MAKNMNNLKKINIDYGVCIAEIKITYKGIFFNKTHTSYHAVRGTDEEVAVKVRNWAKLYHPDSEFSYTIRPELI